MPLQKVLRRFDSDQGLVIRQTTYRISHWPQEDKFKLTLYTKNPLWGILESIFMVPFKATDYGYNTWSRLWEWSMQKSLDSEVVIYTTEISREAAAQIDPHFTELTGKGA